MIARDLGKPGVLGKKSVAGMNGIRAADERRRNNIRNIEIRTRYGAGADAERFVSMANVQRIAIGFRKNGDGLHAQFAACPIDAQRNFAAVCDKYLTKHRSAPLDCE